MRADALLRRARRASKSIVGGERLLAALQTAPYLELMKEAVADEAPPVSKISRRLIKEFTGDVDLKALPVRQFIGMAVKAVLAEEGYEPMETGVKIANDPVFGSGSTYRPADDPEVDRDDDLLSRFVAALTPEEVQRVKALIDEA